MDELTIRARAVLRTQQVITVSATVHPTAFMSESDSANVDATSSEIASSATREIHSLYGCLS